MGEWETEKHPLELSATNFVLLLVKVTKKVRNKGKVPGAIGVGLVGILFKILSTSPCWKIKVRRTTASQNQRTAVGGVPLEAINDDR